MFVHEPLAGRRPAGGRRRTPRRWPTSCAGCSSGPATDPALEVDADLRPEGKQGPLVRTLDSLRRLLRQVVAGLGGAGAAPRRRRRRRRDLRRALHRADRPDALPRGRPQRPTTSCEVRRIKARVDAERLPRGADPNDPPQARVAAASPTSSGPCSCCRCGTPASVPGLRTPRTLDGARPRPPRPGSRAGGRRGARRTAWRLVSRVRNAVTLVRGKPARPAAARRPRAGRGGLGPRLPAGGVRRDGQRLPAATRRARAVVDRVFWE